MTTLSCCLPSSFFLCSLLRTLHTVTCVLGNCRHNFYLFPFLPNYWWCICALRRPSTGINESRYHFSLSLSFYTAAEVGSSSTTHAAANRSRKCGIYWWLQMSKISKTIALARFLGAHAVFCSLRITTLTFFKCRRQQCSNAYTKESNLNGDNAMQKAWKRLSTIVLHIHTGWIRETRRGGYKKNWWKIIIGNKVVVEL